MAHRPIRLVTGLAALAGLTPWSVAAENGGIAGPGTNPLPASGTSSPVMASPQRQVFISGLVDLDYLAQDNYLNADSDDRGDLYKEGLIRGEFGARVELDEKIEAKLTMAYQAQMGGQPFVRSVDAAAVPPADAQNTDVVLDDAFVVLKEFLNYPQASLKAGRQPVAWNLRTDYGAFLFDSRANHPEVSSWDGVKIQLQLETLVFHPYAYALPDDSRLYGLALDWQPEQGAANGLFITGSANVQRDAEWALQTGRTLFTYYGGLEMRFDNGIDLFGEGAMQRGTATSDLSYRGYAFSGGLEWRPNSVLPMSFGVQGDFFSGDDNATDGDLHTFVNPWEGFSDTYIVEHEKYGELSELTHLGPGGTSGVGLQAAKVKAEVALDQGGRFRLRTIYGYYQTSEDVVVNGDRDFGQEVDLSLSWQYNDAGNAHLTFLGGAFLPDEAYQALSPGVVGDNDDMIWLFATNLQVAF
ncbi:MAG: alginate export family protein [Planctomycetes bacterium]|nr:alginate export family protein [Planctomycetota bacterium]